MEARNAGVLWDVVMELTQSPYRGVKPRVFDGTPGGQRMSEGPFGHLVGTVVMG